MSDEMPDVIYAFYNKVFNDNDHAIEFFGWDREPQEGNTKYYSDLYVTREYVRKAEPLLAVAALRAEIDEFKAESVPRELVEQLIETVEYTYPEGVNDAIQSIREQMNE